MRPMSSLSTENFKLSSENDIKSKAPGEGFKICVPTLHFIFKKEK